MIEDVTAFRAADGRTMIGHVIVCRGSGHDNEDALAVWQLNTEGANTGAWVTLADEVLTDAVAAKTLLSTCRQRAVIDWDPAEAIGLLRALEGVAGVDPQPWEQSAVAIPLVLKEIAAARDQYSARVDEERKLKKSIQPLEWDADLPDPLPTDPEQLRRFAGLALPTGACPVAADALSTGRLVRWCAQRWQETTAVLGRRDYLRTAFGQPRTLPAEWEARVADAYLT